MEHEKTNKGEQKHTNILLGDFHQASAEVFCNQAAGTQCTMNCLMAIIKANCTDPSTWQTEDINEVLLEGNTAHLNVLYEKGWPAVCNESKLGVDELPNILQCEMEKNIVAEVRVTGVSYGMSRDIGKLIHLAMKRHPWSIIRVHDKCMAILRPNMKNKTYYLFDPHSCGKTGEVHPNGAACLLTFMSIDGLIQHLKKISNANHEDQIDVNEIHVQLIIDADGSSQSSNDAGTCLYNIL